MPHKVIDGKVERTAIAIGTPQWIEFLQFEKSFRYESCKYGGFTATKQHDYWYASRKYQGTLYRKYIAVTLQLDTQQLEAAAKALSEMIVPQLELTPELEPEEEPKVEQLEWLQNEFHKLQNEHAAILERLAIIEGKWIA